VETYQLPPKLLPFFIVVFVSTMGVLWEIVESTLDSLLGTHMQYSLSDTATDLVSDALGGLVFAFISPSYLKHRSGDSLIQEMQVEKTVRKLTGRNQ